jgi:hypothetical protein
MSKMALASPTPISRIGANCIAYVLAVCALRILVKAMPH